MTPAAAASDLPSALCSRELGISSRWLTRENGTSSRASAWNAVRRGSAVYYGLCELARARCHREAVWEVQRMGRTVRREVNQERGSRPERRWFL